MASRPTKPLASRTVLSAAIAGNVAVAATKFAAAGWTGSSAMLSEAVHSVVDTGNSVLILYGMHRASQPPDHHHPFGYWREIYFRSFVVALSLEFDDDLKTPALEAKVMELERRLRLSHPDVVAVFAARRVRKPMPI